MHLNKVLILHSSNGYGGAEKSLLEFLQNLNGYPVEIHLALSSQLEKLFKEKVEAQIHFHNFDLFYLKKHQSIKYYFRSLFYLLISNYKIFELVNKQNIRTVYCNTFRTLPYCLLINLLNKTRVICHCRDNSSSKSTLQLIRYGSDKSIAVSLFIKQQIASDNRVTVIYNGVNTRHYSDSKPSGWLHRSLGLSPNIKLIGNIGQIVPWKNQTDYVLAANELIKTYTNVHFFLIGGSADDDYFKQLKRQIHSLSLESYFTLTGHVEDVKKYIVELDILLHTAINEPFGRVIIEAGAASKPVVAYNSGGVPEIIRNGETGFLVQDKDIYQMVEFTTLLLNNQLLRESIGRAARKLVAEKFNSKDYTCKLYNALTND